MATPLCSINRANGSRYDERVRLTIELDREADGRWIANVAELGILLYGETRESAIERAQTAAREIFAAKIQRGELPGGFAEPDFAVAA